LLYRPSLLACSYVLDRLRGLATHEFDEAVLPRAQPLVCAGPVAFLQLVLQAAGERQGIKLQVSVGLGCVAWG
jgi:hypothetical protein